MLRAPLEHQPGRELGEFASYCDSFGKKIQPGKAVSLGFAQRVALRSCGKGTLGRGMAAMNGTTGNDTLVGGVGDDTLVGLEGDDRLEGAGGNDSLNGGWGYDVALFPGSGAITRSCRSPA
jgi:Ca2+-binding RTX toxin-like protein